MFLRAKGQYHHEDREKADSKVKRLTTLEFRDGIHLINSDTNANPNRILTLLLQRATDNVISSCREETKLRQAKTDQSLFTDTQSNRNYILMKKLILNLLYLLDFGLRRPIAVRHVTQCGLCGQFQNQPGICSDCRHEGFPWSDQ